MFNPTIPLIGSRLEFHPTRPATDVAAAVPHETIGFSRKSLATFLQVSLRTLDRLDAGGKLPAAVRIGMAKRWPRGLIEEWLRLGCPGREEMAALRRGRK